MLKSIIFAVQRNVFVNTKLIGFKLISELQLCYFSVLRIFEFALQHANCEIVIVVTIYLEVQWQRKKLFLSDIVCVITKSVSDISACLSNILGFWAFLAMN